MAEPALAIRGLSKFYSTKAALRDFSVTVNDGDVCALVGPNGAGKTTLINLLLGLTHPDSGSIAIYGHRAGSISAHRHVGFLPDVPSFPGWMTAEEVLRLFLDLSGKSDHSVVHPLLDAVGLSGNSRPVRQFSRGMKQRLGLAQALAGSPRLLVLDEPTSALDPSGRRLFHEIIRSLRGRATVLYSTHSLMEAESVCSSTIIVHEGQLIRHATLDELIHEGQGLIVDVTGPVEALVDRLRSAPWVRSVATKSDYSRTRIFLTVTDLPTAQHDLLPLIIDTGALLYSLEPRGLEDIFLEFTASETLSNGGTP